MAQHKTTGQNPQCVQARSHHQPEKMAGHVMHHDEVANKVLLWRSSGPRRRCCPNTILREVIEMDSMLSAPNLVNAMINHDTGRNASCHHIKWMTSASK